MIFVWIKNFLVIYNLVFGMVKKFIFKRFEMGNNLIFFFRYNLNFGFVLIFII